MPLNKSLHKLWSERSQKALVIWFEENLFLILHDLDYLTAVLVFEENFVSSNSHSAALCIVSLLEDSDSAESLLDSVVYRIPPNPLDSAESESKDSVVHYFTCWHFEQKSLSSLLYILVWTRNACKIQTDFKNAKICQLPIIIQALKILSSLKVLCVKRTVKCAFLCSKVKSQRIYKVEIRGYLA